MFLKKGKTQTIPKSKEHPFRKQCLLLITHVAGLESSTHALQELQFLNGTQNLFDGFVNASGIEDQKCNMWLGHCGQSSKLDP